MQTCLFCGGDASERNHRARCDGRQGRAEATAPVFDRPAARAARDAALVVVEHHAAPDFLAEAERALYAVAREQPTLTTDDVWRALGATPTTHERRAMGPVMMRGKSHGWVVPTEQMASSAMVSCHSRRKMVWRSLIAVAS